ncbi:MAG: ABC transporter ATP-binding protein [Planctomycetes bacterium]|nr:ABC transporter ATP-binding protein [Planctomycetota bacterium]
MIELDRLSKTYDDALAVDRLSFTVQTGDIFGFIGPNGAGKTTTIKILATLLDPTAGAARIDGMSVVDEPEAVRRIVGFMPDYYGVYDGISVWEFLDFFAATYGLRGAQRRKVVEDVMALTDLAPLRDKLMVSLSKGMKQRACLAKILLHDPKVLILDEPAAGLDPRARIEFRMLLKELRSMGKTVFLSSHILTELADVCNRVAILERGRLVAAGTVDEIVAGIAPVRAWRFTLAAEAPRAAELCSKFAKVRAATVEGNAVRVEVEEGCEIPALVKVLALADLPIVGLAEEKIGLEDVFMRTTKGEVA